jgi:hypothetical protein
MCMNLYIDSYKYMNTYVPAEPHIWIIYICIYVYIYIYLHIYIYKYIYIHMFLNIFLYIYMYIKCTYKINIYKQT